MAPVNIPFPITSAPGYKPGEGQGYLLNCYPEKLGDGVIFRRFPGLALFALLASNELRGFLAVANTLYVVVGPRVYMVDQNGGILALDGAIVGTGPVSMARNNKAASPDIVIVAGLGNYVITDNAVLPYPDNNLPLCNSVSFLDGFFLFTTTSGDQWASELNSTVVNALSFAKAEAKPDGLRRGVVMGEQFLAMGPASIEVSQNVGTLPYPLQRTQVIPVGLLGAWAVSGFEDGWDKSLIFVASDSTVRMLEGYTPRQISNADIERDIASVADKSTLIACCYTFGGQAVWSLSSPTFTWDYNVTAGSWIKRESLELDRWRGQFSVRIFDKWLVGDIKAGAICSIEQDLKFENGEALIFGMDSGPVKQFPSRIRVPKAYFDFTLGQGVESGEDPIQTDPQMMLSWSLDGGARWSIPVLKSIRRQGKYAGLVQHNRSGISSHHGIRYRWRISDPVDVAFSGARLDPIQGN